MMPCIGEMLRLHGKRLQAAHDLDAVGARIEVQCLLQAVLRVNRAYLLTHPEQQLDSEQQARYAALFERRLNGEPLAYILGEREFYGLDFRVTPATLIPRPDTELLVELALSRLQQHPNPSRPPLIRGGVSAAPSFDKGRAGEVLVCRVLDLGTGSGAIALAVAHTRPDVEVTAVDASPDALEVARENARRLGIANVHFVQSDWFAALSGERFDLIVSNPPYIAEDDAHLAQGDVRFEPRTALASGADGLDDIRRIVAQAKAYLSTGGWLLFEHSYDQAASARELLEQAEFAEVFSACDLAGIERVTGGRA